MTPAAADVKRNSALKEQPVEGEGVNLDHPMAAHLVVADRGRGEIATRDGGPRRRKIAVCGFASATRHYMAEPMASPDWEIWGLNQLYRHIPRADVWFDIHYNWDKETVPGTDYRGWLRESGLPFYMLEPVHDIPNSLRFPVEALVRHFGADYFTSTIAYMVALAVFEIDRRVSREFDAIRAEEAKALANGEMVERPANIQTLCNLYSSYTLGVFGVDLTVTEEYFDQKPCAEFWLGLAVARGIEVRIPPESALCKARVRYGTAPEGNALITANEVAMHKAQLEAERLEIFKRLCMLEGAIECDERWRQVAELRSRGSVV